MIIHNNKISLIFVLITIQTIAAHTPINMPFNEKFFVNAYPFLKATIAVLLVMKLNFKEASNVLKEYSFPVPYNVNKLG